MSLKINDNIDLPNSITAHNRISLKSVSVSGGGASPELIARVAKLERTVTKQQGAIEEMDRDLEGVHGTLESVGTDIDELDTAMSAAEGEISAIHNKNAAQDAAIATKQDQLTFDSTPTEDSDNPVTSDGIFKSLADVIEIAEGKTNSFTLSAQTVGNEPFNSQAGSIEVAAFTDINGNEVAANELKIGDIILVTELDVPDRWVGTIGETVTLYRMETAKVDLSGYYTKGETDTLLAGKVDNATLDEYETISAHTEDMDGLVEKFIPIKATNDPDFSDACTRGGVLVKGTYAGMNKNPLVLSKTHNYGFEWCIGANSANNGTDTMYISLTRNNTKIANFVEYYSGYSKFSISNIKSINGKDIPSFPSDTTKTYTLEQNIGGGLAWNEKLAYGFRVIEPPASATLTEEQIALFKEGVSVNGSFGGYQKPLFLPCTSQYSSNVYFKGIMIGSYTNDATSGKICRYTIVNGVLTISSPILTIEETTLSILQKAYPTYPSAQTNKKYHFVLDNGTLTWQDMSSDYYTKSETDAAIQAAIGDAIGGTY